MSNQNIVSQIVRACQWIVSRDLVDRDFVRDGIENAGIPLLVFFSNQNSLHKLLSRLVGWSLVLAEICGISCELLLTKLGHLCCCWWELGTTSLQSWSRSYLETLVLSTTCCDMLLTKLRDCCCCWWELGRRCRHGLCRFLRGCRCRTSASRSYTRLAIFGNTISDQHQDDGGDDDY